MEGTGYETRQTSKGHVIVIVFAWSRGIDPAQSEHYSCCISEEKRSLSGYFSLKKFNVTSICLKTIPVH